GEIHRDRVAADLRGDGLGRGLVAIQHGDFRAGLGQPDRAGPADALGASGDQGGAAKETGIGAHCASAWDGYVTAVIDPPTKPNTIRHRDAPTMCVIPTVQPNRVW